MRVLTSDDGLKRIVSGGWYWYEPGGYLVYATSDLITVTVPSSLLTRADIEATEWAGRDTITMLREDEDGGGRIGVYVELDAVVRACQAERKIGEVFGWYIQPWINTKQDGKRQ